MSDVVTSLVGAQTRIGRLEKENAVLRDIIADAYRALQDGRKGDALKLLRPTTITAPIAASGDPAW